MPESMHQNTVILGREQPIKNTAEVQGDYTNFKRNKAEKDKFCHIKSQQKPDAAWQRLSQRSRVEKVDK